MRDVSKADSGLSALALAFELPENRPEWPTLKILVDGHDPFEGVGQGWLGFYPGDMLDRRSPLIPEDPARRVAVCRCSCGEPGCGVMAPLVVASPDGARVSWVDFRNYVGVFDGPTTPTVEDFRGKPWGLPDIHFYRDQYVSEITRASNDRSWETPRRRTARLLHQRLKPFALVLPPNLTLVWVVPAWREEGIILMFEHRSGDGPGFGIVQRALHLTSARSDPAAAAEEMSRRLLSVAPGDWARVFGYRED